MTATPTDPQQFNSSSLAPQEGEGIVLQPQGGKPKKRQTWFWPGVWLLLLAASSGLGLWAIAMITRLPPLPNCNDISVFSADSERLYCARQASVTGAERDLVAGVQLIADWDESHPLYQDSQEVTNRWSKGLFKLAQQRMQAGNLDRAVQLLGYIPPRAEIHGEAAAVLERWQQEWSTGEEISAAVTEAVTNQNWSGARKELREIKRLTSDYWLKERYLQLGRFIQREEDARRDLIKAHALAEEGDMADLAEALGLVRQIDVQTQAWPEAKPLIEEWARTLLNYGFRLWEQEDLEGAIALKGIGRTTAGGILSAAFNLPVAILDGNVKRVLGIHDEELRRLGHRGQVRAVLPRQVGARGARMVQHRGAEGFQPPRDLIQPVLTAALQNVDLARDPILQQLFQSHHHRCAIGIKHVEVEPEPRFQIGQFEDRLFQQFGIDIATA